MIVLVSKGYFEELTAFADAIVDRSANLTDTVSRYYIHQVAANAWMYFEFALYHLVEKSFFRFNLKSRIHKTLKNIVLFSAHALSWFLDSHAKTIRARAMRFSPLDAENSGIS